MSKSYIASVNQREPRPRSSRLRELGTSGTSVKFMRSGSELTPEQLTGLKRLMSWFDYDDVRDAVFVKPHISGNDEKLTNFYVWGNSSAGGIGESRSSGSTVRWTQIYDSQPRVQIATIAIDGVDIPVYAPQGGTSALAALTIGQKSYNGSNAVTVQSSDIVDILGYTPYNAANIGGASVAYATNAGQLGGLEESRFFRKNLIYTSADCNTMEANSFTILNQDAGSLTCANMPSSATIAGGYGVLTVKHSGYANQIFFPYGGNGSRLYFREQVYSGGIIWNSWKEIYHSGNLTKSTLGLGNVDNLSSENYFVRSVGSVNGNYINGTTFTNLQNGTYRHSSDGFTKMLIHFANSASSASGLDIYSDSYLQGASYPLKYRKSIDGNRFAGGWISLYDSSNCNNDSVNWSANLLSGNGLKLRDVMIECSSTGALTSRNGEINRYNGVLHLQYNTDNSLSLCAGGGKVGIGTTSPSEKMDVVGNISAGTSSGGGYISLKGGQRLYHGMFTANIISSSYSSRDLAIYTDNTLHIWAAGGIVAHNNFVCSGQVTAGSASDIRLKDNVRTLSAELVLSRLRGVEFDWNSVAASACPTLRGHDVGCVAQEVQSLIPSAVSPIFGRYLRVDYSKITPYLVEGWKDHEKRIEALEFKLKNIQS